MRRRPEPLGLVLVAVAGLALAAEEPTGRRLFDPGGRLGQGEPITVTSDTLEYDYKANVVVYEGDVSARQGRATVRSDRLIVTFAKGKDGNQAAVVGEGGLRLQEIEAVGGVRIDYGTSWATGGRAVFDQSARTFVLTDDPVLHDGANEVAGERVVVYLDEERSVVEGGRKRVKAVLYPDDGKPAPAATDAEAAAPDAAAATPDAAAVVPGAAAATPDAAARPSAGGGKTAAVEETAVAPAATRVPRPTRRHRER